MHPQGTPEAVSIHHVTQQHFVKAAKALLSGIWMPVQAARVIAEHRHLIQDENCVDALRCSNATAARLARLGE